MGVVGRCGCKQAPSTMLHHAKFVIVPRVCVSLVCLARLELGLQIKPNFSLKIIASQLPLSMIHILSTCLSFVSATQFTTIILFIKN